MSISRLIRPLCLILCCLLLCASPAPAADADRSGGNPSGQTKPPPELRQGTPLDKTPAPPPGKDAGSASKGMFQSLLPDMASETENAGAPPEEKLAMLDALQQHAELLKKDIAEARKAIERSPKQADTTALTKRLNELNRQLHDANRDFDRIATGVEPAAQGDGTGQEDFDWKKEMAALINPMIKEMRAWTAATRQKAELRERIALLERQAQDAGQAMENLGVLLAASQDKALNRRLAELQGAWQKEQTRLNGRLDVARMDLDGLTNGASVLGKASSGLTHFLKTRGLYLCLGMLAFACTFLLLQLLFRQLARQLLKNTEASPHRRIYARLVAVFSRLLSIVLALIALLAVFFVAADWFMISLVVLFCLGILWTLRQTLPRQWERSLLLLNMGSVREGERLILDGLPWRVDKLGMYCYLSNPALKQALRIPIERLSSLVSRPYDTNEPWFPCKKGDHLLLGGTVVQVTGLSSEQVVLLNLATGATQVHGTVAFLGMGAGSMATKFMVKTTLGLSYDLQADITDAIPGILRSHLQTRLDEEGYAAQCLGMGCEFTAINASTLDIAVVLEFDGALAGLYYRLKRVLERWCVECCTANNWEIPFSQIVVHQAADQVADALAQPAVQGIPDRA